MKFSFTSRNSVNDESHVFHQNLFGAKPDSLTDDDYDEEFTDENEYTSCNQTKHLEMNDLSLPLTDTIAEFVQELSEDKFFINDISFIFELSRKRAISPCAIVVALIYLKRLKAKSKTNVAFNSFYNINESSSCNNYIYNYDKYSANCLSNTELCLISLLLASKYLVDEGEDEEIYNEEWADLVDFPVEKVNKIERSILKQLEWELYVSKSEFWSFTAKLTERITRKKVKYQHYQCTYSDLDYLLSNSTQFSVDTLKSNLDFLTKIILICSSTIVYMAVSSFVISSCVFYLKNQLTLNLSKISTELTIDSVNKTITFQNNLNIINETNEMNMMLLNENNYKEIESKHMISNKTRNFFDKICLINENFNFIKTNFFRKLWQTSTINNQNLERLHLASHQMKPITSHHYYQLIL